MGSNFLGTMIGAFLSGITYTTAYGRLSEAGHPGWVWYALAIHTGLAVVAFALFVRFAGEFKEMEQ